MHKPISLMLVWFKDPWTLWTLHLNHEQITGSY